MDTEPKPHKVSNPEDIKTPGAKWREGGGSDPFGDRYDCSREDLPLGSLTDDQLANAVFIHGNSAPHLEDVINGTAKMPIVYLEAAKSRIRWLSRKLASVEEKPPIEVWPCELPLFDPVLTLRQGGCTPQRMAEEYEIPTANRATFKVMTADKQGVLTYQHLLVEAVSQATDPKKAREALLKAAAIALTMAEKLKDG